jgi:hypothetical protein
MAKSDPPSTIHIDASGGKVTVEPRTSSTTNNIYGQVMHLGDGGAVVNSPMTLHASPATIDAHDLMILADALNTLKQGMASEARRPEHFRAVAEIASAQEAAEAGDSRTAWTHLKAAGQWALDAATQLGIAVAGAALKSALELSS